MKKQGSQGDEILRDLFTGMELVEPPEGFTERVMNRVSAEKTYAYQTARPLIGKAGWIILIVIFAGLITVAFLPGQGTPGLISQYLDLDFSLNLNFLDALINRINSFLTFSTGTWSYILLGFILASILIIADRTFNLIRPDRRQ